MNWGGYIVTNVNIKFDWFNILYIYSQQQNYIYLQQKSVMAPHLLVNYHC